MAVKAAYSEGLPAAARYEQWVINNAERFGLSPQDLHGIQDPVLVRVREDEVGEDVFVQEANERGTASMSATEQARADASRLTHSLLNLWNTDSEGNINAASNREFAKKFFGRVVNPSEWGNYMREDGSLSSSGITRIRDAMFHAAYGDDSLVSRL